MIEGFDHNKIKNTDFCICSEPENEEIIFKVPVSEDIQVALKEMLNETFKQWSLIEGEWNEFELSEQYASKEKLLKDLDDKEIEKLQNLFNKNNYSINSEVLSKPEDFIYYFVVFTDNKNNRLVAVKRASKMKGLLGQRNRLMKLVDDTLKIVNHSVFRLDNDFDFVITKEKVYILRPTSLEYIADVDSFVKEKAKEKALDLGKKIKFINFESISEFASSHKSAARLVASISVRKNLEKINKDKLLAYAKKTGVDFENKNGMLNPKQGYEVAFLEVLDRRRYEVDLENDEPEAFVASSRRALKKGKR
jgi:hypothetical protein